MAYRTYAPNNGFIVSKDGTGDFTTIQAAITVAPANTTIFINDGTYSENITISKNISLICNVSDYRFVSNSVVVSGTITITENNTKVTLQNLSLEPSLNYAINSTGNLQSILVFGCNYLIPIGVIGINSTGVSTNIYNFNTFFANYGQLFNVVNSGVIWFYSSRELDNVPSTPSILNASGIYARESYFLSEMDFNASTMNATFCIFGSEFFSSDQTFLNFVGSQGICDKCSFYSDTKTSIILDVTSNLELIDAVVQSTSMNAISGSGTLLLTNVNFLNSSNVQPTITPYTTLIGKLNLVNPLTVSYGGTGLSSLASGSLLYGSGSTTLTALPIATNGDILQLQGGVPKWTTASFPITVGGAGSILRSDGTNWAATTATYPATTTINQLLYSSSANTIGGLATANSSVLVTSAGGIPSFSGTLPFTVPVTTGGTGKTSVTANALIAGGTTTTAAFVSIPSVSSGYVLTDNGSGTPPTFQAIGGSGPQTVNVAVTGIDFKASATTLLYTPPLGFNFLTFQASYYYTTLTVLISQFTGSLGTNAASYDNIVGTDNFGNPTGSTTTYLNNVPSGNFAQQSAISTNALPIYFNNTTPAVATTAIGTIVLQGILVAQ